MTELPEPKKACKKCEKDYPLSHFCKDAKRKSGLSSNCRDCRVKYWNEYKVKHPEKIREYKRNYDLRKKYGIDLGMWDDTLVAQGGVCLICGSDDRLVLDHDHQTGFPRSILCHNCNVGIGHFKEDPNFLRKAIRYLEACQEVTSVSAVRSAAE